MTRLILMDYLNEPYSDLFGPQLHLSETQQALKVRGGRFARVYASKTSPDDARDLILEWSAHFQDSVSGAVSGSQSESWGAEGAVDVAVHVSHGSVFEVPRVRGHTVPAYLSDKVARPETLVGNMDERWDWDIEPGRVKYSRSTILLKRRDRRFAQAGNARVDDWVVSDRTLVPKVPTQLFVAYSCRSLAEPSLANAFHERGTRFVLGARKAIRPGGIYATRVDKFLAACVSQRLDGRQILLAFAEHLSKGPPGPSIWPTPVLSLRRGDPLEDLARTYPNVIVGRPQPGPP